jgi:NADPH2:quinone reductase
MKAVWYERQGPAAEVLIVGETDTPTAAAGEVRVKLAASGVNPSDCNRRRGAGYPLEYPRVIPNSDGAGIVDQVGDGVPREWLGRRVWLYNGQRGRAFGTAAEYIALDVDLVSPLPDSVSFGAGATLGVPCMTAHRCVFRDGPVHGRTVLVTGGAGAVGHYAIQLAKWGGAQVVTTVSSEPKAAHARGAGADCVLNYRTEDVVERVRRFTEGRGVDRIVEVDFAANLETSLKVLRLNAAIAAYASTSNRTPVIPFYDMMRRNVTVQAFVLSTLPLDARRQAQEDINHWLETGPRLHTIAGRFPLEETARAHAAVEAGTKLGTVVVLCQPGSPLD